MKRSLALNRTLVWSVTALLAVLLLGLSAYWRYGRWTHVTTYDPPAEQARRQPLLAAQRLAQALGRPTRGVVPQTLDWLPDTPTTVLLPAGRQFALPQPTRDALVAWVRRGGHLVLELEAPGVPDPLAEALQAGSAEFDAPETEAEERARLVALAQLAEPFGRDPALPRSELAARWSCQRWPQSRLRLFLPTQQAPLSAEFYTASILRWSPQRPPRWALFNEYGPQAAGFQLGRGQLSLLTSFGPFANPHHALSDPEEAEQLGGLVALDNAALFAWLIAQDGAPRQPVVVVHRLPHIGLLNWLYAEAGALLVALAVLLALGLWRVLPRFGALLPPTAAHRPGLSAHLLASAVFIARHSGYDSLLTAQRERLRDTLRRLGLPRGDTAAHHAELERRTGIATQRWQTALSQPARTATAYLRISQQLAQLRQALRPPAQAKTPKREDPPS